MKQALVVVGPTKALMLSRKLLEYHALFRPVTRIEIYDEKKLDNNFWSQTLTGNEAAVLYFYNSKYAPSGVAPGVSVPASNGKSVPISLIPITESIELITSRIVQAHYRRQGNPPGPIALLNQRGLESEEEIDNIEDILLSSSIKSYRWGSERINKATFMHAIQTGSGVALYRGRGTVQGWMGYNGVMRSDFDKDAGEHPIGALLALTCSSASRFRARQSFVEMLLMKGYTLSALAATGQTVTTHNRNLTQIIARELATGKCNNLADLVTRIDDNHTLLKHYRLFGDPLAPLAGEANAEDRHNEIYAPSPKQPLAPLPEEIWPRCMSD